MNVRTSAKLMVAVKRSVGRHPTSLIKGYTPKINTTVESASNSSASKEIYGIICRQCITKLWATVVCLLAVLFKINCEVTIIGCDGSMCTSLNIEK